MIEQLKKFRRWLLRKLKLRPIDRVFAVLNRKQLLPFHRGVEVFGYTGEYHTMNYIGFVKELHVWEIAADCEERLRQNLPKALVKIADSFQEIERTEFKFDLMVIDNHQSTFGPYCEHFEFLPKVFSALNNSATVILNVVPNVEEVKVMYKIDITEQQAKRNAWYRVENADRLSETFLLDFYKQFFEAKGYLCQFSFVCRRNQLVSYLVVHLRKKGLDVA